MPNETVSSTNNCMLTTVDNPFDPFDDFTSWFLFDIEKGYDSCGKVMRIAKLSDDLTEKEEALHYGYRVAKNPFNRKRRGCRD